MSIVKMRKLRVISAADRKESLLEGLQRLGCVEISEPTEVLADPVWEEVFRRGRSALPEMRNRVADVNTALAVAAEYAKTKGHMLAPRSFVTEERFLSDEMTDAAKTHVERIKETLEKRTRLQNETDGIRTAIAALQPWRSLELLPEEMETAHTVNRPGVFSGNTDIGKIRMELEAAELAAELFEISRDTTGICCVLICHRADEAAAQEVLRPLGFSAVTFRERKGTVEEAIQQLEQRAEENRAAQRAAEAQLEAESEHRELLKLYADRLQTEISKMQSAERMVQSEKVLFFQGWMPAESEDAVKALLERQECAWEATDPTEEEYPDVPVRLKNNRFTRPLNVVTNMYVMPAYDGIDPNPLMAPFFITFYGLMMADMGYGLLMLLGAWILLKKMRARGELRDFGGLLGLCGISTLLFGALTGSFLGDFIPQLLKIIDPGSTFRLPYLFTPMEDTLAILVGALALGFLQMMTGMAISVVKKFRDGRIMDAVWDEITWWVILTGTALVILRIGNAAGYPVVLLIGILMLVTGAMVNGKGFGKVTGLIGAVYNGVTGYFSDTLSYARLMALMLAGSVIAQVFNTLGAVTGNVVGFVLISFAGNLLNFALNLLGCYVHDLRLQCLEFFGRFYKEGGRAFEPLRVQTKYVDILEENEGGNDHAGIF